MLFALTTLTALASPLTLNLDDDRATAVVLDCGGKKTQATVKDGVAQFTLVPTSSCTVHVIRTAGNLDGPGTWTCTDEEGCVQDEIHHAEVSDAPGRLNIILAGDYVHNEMELTCSGYRARSQIVENTAVFNGVPDVDCSVRYLNGPPVIYSPLRIGTHRCELSGSTAICVMQSRP